MSRNTKALIIGACAVLAWMPGPARALFLPPLDPTSGGSWGFVSWGWSGQDGYVFQETGIWQDFTFDRYALFVNARDTFEPTHPNHIATITPASWSLEYATDTALSASGTPLTGAAGQLTLSGLRFNSDTAPDLASFDLTSIAYNGGVVVEYATITGTYSFSQGGWIEPYTTVYYDPSAIPEPASLLVLGTGLLGLTVRKRLRRRSE